MKTLDDIADKYCQDHFGELSLYRYLLHSTSPANTEAGIKMLMKEYARACCEASLKKADKNALIYEDEHGVWEIAKESITSPENITLC